MRVDIVAQPAYAIAYVKMAAGESVLAERGAMVACSAGIAVEATMTGGVVQSALRKAFAGESFFQTRYVSDAFGAWVALAPRFPGDITSIELAEPGAPLLVQSGSLLGHGDLVATSPRVGDIGTMLLREGITVIKASGQGPLLIASYGGLQKFTLGDGESLVVDTGHLVAWSSTASLRIGPVAGVFSSVFSGEGIVGEMVGPGDVYLQTRAEQGMREWLFPDRTHNKS